jgi:hypothetical protein
MSSYISGLQSARAAAYRALCLGSLIKRHELECAVKRLREDAVPDGVRRYITSRHWTENQRLLHWVSDECLDAHFSKAESILLGKTFATWSDKALAAAGWRSEALGIILWALRFVDDLPAFDTRFDIHVVMSPLEVLTPTIDFVWQAGLRPAENLRQLREIAELWHWRSRVAELQLLGVKPQDGVSFAEIIRSTAEQGYQDRLLPPPIDQDFPAFGKAYNQATSEQQNLLSHIAHERATALNWLCELSSEWESLPIDNF